MKTSDPVNPQHYRNSSGIQLIEVIRWLPFSLGNAIKYAYRNDQKENAQQDLKKALWYLKDYIQNPAFLPAAQEFITPELKEQVFSGVNDFEKRCCLELLSLHDVAGEGNDLFGASAAVIEAINLHIKALDAPTNTADSPTLF